MTDSEEHSAYQIDVPDLEQLGISRLHAALVPFKEHVGIQDIGSTNGTRLNGQRLTPRRVYNLSHKDELHIGGLELEVHFVNEAVYIEHVYEKVLKRFDYSVRELINEMGVSVPVMTTLMNRLPNKKREQLSILSTFQEEDQEVTLELLNLRINRLINATAPHPDVTHDPAASRATMTMNRPQFDEVNGDDGVQASQELEELEIPEPEDDAPDDSVPTLKGLTSELNAESLNMESLAGKKSRSYRKLAKHLHNDIVRIEKRITIYQKYAQRLPDNAEQAHFLRYSGYPRH